MITTRDEELKRVLERWRQGLRRSLDEKLADVRANTGHDGGHPEALDTADASESVLQLDVSLSLSVMTAEVLRRVDDALARIASGDYGVCVDCNGEIPTKRLAAVPFAVRCRDCEELREAEVRRIARSEFAFDSSPTREAQR